MQSAEIIIPWRSKNGYLTPDITIEALNKNCKKLGLQWNIGGNIIDSEAIEVRKISIASNSSNPINTEKYIELFKTNLHSICFQLMIEKIAII